MRRTAREQRDPPATILAGNVCNVTIRNLSRHDFSLKTAHTPRTRHLRLVQHLQLRVTFVPLMHTARKLISIQFVLLNFWSTPIAGTREHLLSTVCRLQKASKKLVNVLRSIQNYNSVQRAGAHFY